MIGLKSYVQSQSESIQADMQADIQADTLLTPRFQLLLKWM